MSRELFSFIAESPTPFHAVRTMSRILQKEGFTILAENQHWDVEPNGRYFVIRNGSLIAFCLEDPAAVDQGFRIIGAHTDSPSLQLKPQPKSASSQYLQFGVEKYGGALLSTWFDRELSLAGRITVLSEENAPHSCLIDFKEPVLSIPSLAIHLNREANAGFEINAQQDLSPVLAQNISGTTQWEALLLEKANLQNPGLAARSILGSDLFCYDPSPPRYFGLDNNFISGPRLDNLLSCYIGLQALLQRRSTASCMLLFTNHEEVGSTTSSGALSNFAASILSRLCDSVQSLGVCASNSFLLSLDNAHAAHPNFVDKTDPDHNVLLNTGPVLKLNSSQRYCSSAVSGAIFRLLCAEAGVEVQDFVMRSDMACGSTIGPLTTAKLGIDGVDVGVPTWAMHSIREVTGSLDPLLLERAACHFFNRDTLPNISNT
jgi:aspartyl aminopeptidase